MSTKVKRFKLNLKEYKVSAPRQKLVDDGEGGKKLELVTVKEFYPQRENMSVWLRTSGIFKSAEEIVEAITLAKQIRDHKEDSILLDEREAQILKQATNKIIEMTAEGRAGLGGELHEEAIVRVVTMEEVEIEV